MKGLFKFLFGIIIFLVITIGIPVGILYYSIVDNTDDTPKELYTADVTLEAQLTSLIDRAFDLEDKDYIDITFTEAEINKMIYAIIRDSTNSSYAPNSSCTTDACRYIMTEEFTAPVLGDVKMHVKGIFATVKDDQLGIYVTMEAMGIKTRAKLEATFNETADAFIIKFETLGLGRSNLLSGVASQAMFWVLNQMDFTATVINQKFAEMNLPFELDMENFSLVIDKDNVNDLLKQIISADDMDESNEKAMLSELFTSLTAKENGLVKFGVFGNSFGIRFDLEKFRVAESLLTLDPRIMNFDEDLFIQNKVQGFIISNLVPTASSKMVFTNLEFNQIIYSQSNGYDQFKLDLTIPNSTSTIKFEILGILIDFNASDVEIRINVNLNGLETSIKLVGDIVNNDSATVEIRIRNQITLGEDVDEIAGEYVVANSSLIMGMLGDNMGDLGVLSYNPTQNAFVLSASSFTQLMALDGSNVSPLTVNRLKIVNNALYVYASIDAADPLSSVIGNATNAISGALANNTLTSGDFNTTDPDEAALIDNFINILDDVADGLTNDTLSEETTTEFIELLNQMSEENRNTFLDNLESTSGSSDLLDLYDSLFGR